jgi:hypothetical protein
MSKKMPAFDIHRKYYSNVSDEDFAKIVSTDTISSNLQKDILGKYAKWLLNLYQRKCLKIEDLYKAEEYIAIFDKSAKMNRLTDIDLNHYKSLSAMYRVIKPFIKAKSKTEKTREIKANEAEILYEDKAFAVIHPKTIAASCLYGKGTQWCTAAKKHNWFNKYNRKGKLYIIIDKRNNKKFQFHVETKNFMNEEDEPIMNDYSETYILKKINATQGLFNYFISEIPYLYHDFLIATEFCGEYWLKDFSVFYDTKVFYDTENKMYHEFDYNRHTYFIELKDDCCTLYYVKRVGQITRISQVIDEKFGAQKIIPMKNIARQNELIIIKNNHKGIFNLDTGTIRWGYKGTVDDRIDWINADDIFTNNIF